MFAPRVATAQTKAAAPPTNKLAPGRWVALAQRFGAHDEREADPASSTARATPPAPSWDFSKIPIFPLGQANRSSLSAPPLPGVILPKLAVGAVDDPLEREADSVADQVMRMRAPLPAISAAAPQISRVCAACEGEKMQRSPVSPAAVGGAAAPAEVYRVLAQPGRPLDAGTRAFFEPRFARDLGRVRLHDDTSAAQSARAVGARAYTVGNDIAFAAGVDTASDGGRRLLAHELTHTVQQGDGAAARQTLRLQRQVLGATELEAMKDPDCPPETPYRWGPKRGPGGADPAVVAPCMATPMPRPRRNLLEPGTALDQPSPKSPAPPSPAPPPAQPDQQPTPPPSAPGTPTPSVASGAKDQPAADEAYGYDFEDDPLAAGGFGPNDATIRVRPGPVRTTLIRPRPTSLACSYDMRQIAAFGGPAGPMNLAQIAKDVTTAFTGCDIAYVSIDVVPRANDDDPRQHAIERAESIKQQLMQATGPGKFSEDRFDTGLSTGGPGEPEVSVWLGGRNKLGYGSASAGRRGAGSGPAAAADTGKASPGGEENEQVSVQVGLGAVKHYYTSPHGANDPLHEWLSQFMAGYTMQLHAKNKSGEERQIFAQVTYSLTTRQWTVSIGGLESYVIVLRPDLQLSFWAQLMAGENVSSRTQQESLSVGAQFVWQPKDWLAFGAQAGVGPTVQSSGPSSIDPGALIFFQIQK
jgi:hypothetical protein